MCLVLLFFRYIIIFVIFVTFVTFIIFVIFVRIILFISVRLWRQIIFYLILGAWSFSGVLSSYQINKIASYYPYCHSVPSYPFIYVPISHVANFLITTLITFRLIPCTALLVIPLHLIQNSQVCCWKTGSPPNKSFFAILQKQPGPQAPQKSLDIHVLLFFLSIFPLT